MRKLWVLLLFMASANSHGEDWRNPETKFNTTANKAKTVTVTWHPVNDVQQACEKRSREKGFGGFGYSVDACSFWDSDVLGHRCEVYTGKKTTMHELGHEIRHCFQGSFHAVPK